MPCEGAQIAQPNSPRPRRRQQVVGSQMFLPRNGGPPLHHFDNLVALALFAADPLGAPLFPPRPAFHWRRPPSFLRFARPDIGNWQAPPLPPGARTKAAAARKEKCLADSCRCWRLTRCTSEPRRASPTSHSDRIAIRASSKIRQSRYDRDAHDQSTVGNPHRNLQAHDTWRHRSLRTLVAV